MKGRGKGKKGKKGKGKADFDLQMRILQDADALCTTTISSGGDFFSKFAFAGVLIDEAAQATELAAVVPLILRGSQRLVLVGDQCQLPPTVQSTEAEERGLSLSLYSRMADSGGIIPFLLDTQYRSHPSIAAFSAATFYNGQLKNGVTDKDRKPARGLQWPRDNCPILFINCDCDENAEGDSKFNPGEAEIVNRVVQDVFYQRELEVEEVGVVTPYVAQVRVLKRMLKNIIPEGQDPELLEVASVDNFQGREKDLIVFSAVRSNRTGTVGFLADWRRLNVMLTRARRGIVIIGNARTLRSDEHWSKWLDFYHKVSTTGRTRTPSPEKKKSEKLVNETEGEREERLKKERKEAARKLSMAIRFPGLAIIEKKEQSRSPSYDDAYKAQGGRTEFQAQGGRTKPRRRTPSPDRKPLKVHKEVGIGRKEKTNEFVDEAERQTSEKPKAKAKAKVKLAIDPYCNRQT
jgi:regulator of nonsense transcripts 1